MKVEPKYFGQLPKEDFYEKHEESLDRVKHDWVASGPGVRRRCPRESKYHAERVHDHA